MTFKNTVRNLLVHTRNISLSLSLSLSLCLCLSVSLSAGAWFRVGLGAVQAR